MGPKGLSVHRTFLLTFEPNLLSSNWSIELDEGGAINHSNHKRVFGRIPKAAFVRSGYEPSFLASITHPA